MIENTGLIAVAKAYIRLWIPLNAEIAPIDPDAPFFFQGTEMLYDSDPRILPANSPEPPLHEWKRRDFEVSTVYPQVERVSRSFEFAAPYNTEGEIRYRVFTEKQAFPPIDKWLGILTYRTPRGLP